MLVREKRTVEVLGYEVFSDSLKVISPQIEKLLVNTISPNSYGLALKDKEFETALKNTDLLVMDGMGIALGSLLLKGKNIPKIAGQDCFDYFMQLADQHSWKVFFLGSSDATLQKIRKRVKRDFARVTTSSYSPPFKDKFSPEENYSMLEAINSFEPDVLFVGMTAPKQEKWAYMHRDLVNARIISTIGNVFDWYAENSKRPGKIWIKLRLEWLVRIFLRPEILRRNTKNQCLFLKDVFKQVITFRGDKHKFRSSNVHIK
jgi:N-acetylglucosaminyldiphosphoundecaprenol N-acetyl-beta-D-mannosaminyltransferase